MRRKERNLGPTKVIEVEGRIMLASYKIDYIYVTSFIHTKLIMPWETKSNSRFYLFIYLLVRFFINFSFPFFFFFFFFLVIWKQFWSNLAFFLSHFFLYFFLWYLKVYKINFKKTTSSLIAFEPLPKILSSMRKIREKTCLYDMN